jgi:hypothetical protein
MSQGHVLACRPGKRDMIPQPIPENQARQAAPKLLRSMILRWKSVQNTHVLACTFRFFTNFRLVSSSARDVLTRPDYTGVKAYSGAATRLRQGSAVHFRSW